MTFATLYIDEGNLLDFHDDRDTARASVLSVVEEHPEVAEDFGMVELDEHGGRVGDFVSGAKLKAQAAARSRRSRAA
jgi:NDP-sugar pyrophosphorylase family protein